MSTIYLDIAQTISLVTRRGDTSKVKYIFKDSSGNPIDCTAYTFFMEVRTSAEDDVTPSTVVSLGNEAFAVESTNNVTMTISDEIMRNVPGATYTYEIEAVKGGETQTWVRGTFYVREDVAIGDG